MSDIKSYYERINRLLDERDGINGDIADIYQEVKSAGYVPKILRKIIARHRADPSKVAEEDTLLETYEAALDSKTRQAMKLAREGKSAREIEEATGLDHSTVARAVPSAGKRGRKPKLSQPATITKPDVVTPEAAPDALATQPLPAEPNGDRVGDISEEERGVANIPRDDGARDENEASPGPVVASPSPIVQELMRDAARARELAAREEDDLVIPHFLRRVPA